MPCRVEKDAEFPQSADGLEGDNPAREMSCLNEQAVQGSGGNQAMVSTALTPPPLGLELAPAEHCPAECGCILSLQLC